LQDLPYVLNKEWSVVLIDSQGDMIRKILQLVELSPEFVSPDIQSLSERVIYIDPTDIAYPPCLNLFDFGAGRIDAVSDPAEREKLFNGAIELYEYIFGALLGAEMTNKQGVIFTYLARLLMVVPNATIHTLMDFLQDPESVTQYISKVDIMTQRFFLTQFMSSNFDSTRQQILHRLWGVFGKTDALGRMFSHPKNKLNLFEAMNNGSLILINTAKDHLKQEGTELFGRFMIACLAQAIQERAAIPEAQRMPTFIYIDEAQDYFEEGAGIELLLTQARKYRVGVIIANQSLSQLGNRLAATVMANTSAKFVGGVSAEYGAKLAKEINIEPEMLQTLQKTPTEAQFASFVRNLAPEPGLFSVPLGELERRPRMCVEEQQRLLAANRERYCAPYDPNMLLGSTAVINSGIKFNLEDARGV
jgi:hypothetical protein